MKYLFFFNGQLLLLCCMCCKSGIQDFVTGLQKKQEKFMVSLTGTPTDYNPSVFHRELKNIYGIVPHSSTASPTAYNPSVFHRELKKIYEIVPQSSTESLTVLPTYITDGLPRSRSARMSDVCPSTQVPTDFPTDRKV